MPATPWLSVAEPRVVEPSIKVTVPLASAEETVAVSVTDCPKTAVEDDEVRTVVVVFVLIA
jgi:hypothetical protein